MRSLVFVLLSAVSLQAQTPSGARFTATSANVSGAGESIRINVTEWSPDSRRDEFVAAWTLTNAVPQGRGGRGGARGARGAAAVPPVATLPVDPDAVDPDNPAPGRGRGGARGGATAPQTPEASLTAAIKKAPTVGILWTSENVGYSIKYAYGLPQPDGGVRIILATDRRIGMWSNLWQPAASVTPADYPFSIIELHVNAKGEGEGRGVITGKVAVDTTAKTIALDSYDTEAVILKGVKRQGVR